MVGLEPTVILGPKPSAMAARRHHVMVDSEGIEPPTLSV